MAKVKMGRWEVDAEELERQIEEATKRGEETLKTEPQASAVTYDQDTNRLIIELKNGATFIVPCDLIQGLRGANPDEIAEVELRPYGLALHWPKLDQDFSVAGLMAGVFGTKAWMAEMGRKGGRVTSEAKRASSRANGQKGGRPRKEAKRAKG